MPKASDPVRVVSYNVLSSSLCDPKFFCETPPEHLDADARFDKVLNALGIHFFQGAVICLQEVSRQWCDKLAVEFALNNYAYYFAEYGYHKNGYMGVLTAWPNNKFAPTRVSSERITSAKKWCFTAPRDDALEVDTRSDWWKKMCSLPRAVYDAVQHHLYGTPKAPPTSRPQQRLALARNKTNRLLCVELECRDSPHTFVVANVHMPCASKQQWLMVMFSYMVKTLVAEFCQGQPDDMTEGPGGCILAGDFNTLPIRENYSYLLGHDVDIEHTFAGFSPEWLAKWDSFRQPPLPLHTAFPMPYTKCGFVTIWDDFREDSVTPDEHAYSCSNVTRGDAGVGHHFYGAVDHIFYSKHFKCVESAGMPKVKIDRKTGHPVDPVPPMPNAEQGSDHLPIYATFEL